MITCESQDSDYTLNCLSSGGNGQIFHRIIYRTVLAKFEINQLLITLSFSKISDVYTKMFQFSKMLKKTYKIIEFFYYLK